MTTRMCHECSMIKAPPRAQPVLLGADAQALQYMPSLSGPVRCSGAVCALSQL